MRPWQHARSSARGVRNWQDDLELHEFIDVSKYVCADRRHRVVLHHVDLGAEIVKRAFPDRRNTLSIVEQHVTEDLGATVTLSDWFELCNVAELPSPIYRRLQGGAEGVSKLVAGSLPDALHEDVLEVCQLMFLPTRYLPENEALALPVLMNAVGPLLVRRVFGPPVIKGDSVVDYAWIAEAIIYTVFGRIPDLHEVVKCWSGEPITENLREGFGRVS